MLLGSRLFLSSIPFGAYMFLSKEEPIICPKKLLSIEFLKDNGGVELKNSDNPPDLITFQDPFSALFKQYPIDDLNHPFKIPEVLTYRTVQSDHLMKLVGVASASLLLTASMFAKNAKCLSLPARIGFTVSSIFGLGHVAFETNHLPSYSVLTGRTLPYTPSFPISDATKKNLEIAYKILELTDKKTVLNYPERSIDPDALTKETYNEQIARQTAQTYFRNSQQHSVQTVPIANCSELCIFGLHMLRDYHMDIARLAPIRFAVPIRTTKTQRETSNTHLFEKQKEILEVYDHNFLVIGEIPEKPPEITAEWKADDKTTSGFPSGIRDLSNSDAVICDPWTRSYFPAKDLGLFSSDWLGWIQIEGKWRTCITQHSASPVFVVATPPIPLMDRKAPSWIQKIKLFFSQ